MDTHNKVYGTWPSPISAQAAARQMRFSDVQWDKSTQTLVWHELRNGIGRLVAWNELDGLRDLTEEEYSVRGRVGYGGGEFTVADGIVYFSTGNNLYRLPLAEYANPQPITPSFGAMAAPAASPDSRWLAFIHHDNDIDGIAIIDAEGKHWPQKLAYGDDYVMQPDWHPDSTHLAYIAWNAPQMPWNGSELRLITLRTDSILPQVTEQKTLAGNEKTSVSQPLFSPDGRYLAYLSNASGWGQIMLYDLQNDIHQQITHFEAEHDQPAWVQGVRTYVWSEDGRSLYFLRNERGAVSLWRYDLKTENETQIKGTITYTHLTQPAFVNDHKIAVIASSPTQMPRILITGSERIERIVRRSGVEFVTESQLSNSQAIEWIGHDGATVHGIYTPPVSSEYKSTGAPPLLVMVHGGPTSQRFLAYDIEAQFFATRGYAVLQVNYRGSTGYGRDYMDKHYQAWGTYDVEDCASGASHLVAQGLADPERLVIMGGSAGGYTVLQSLVDKPGFYRVGISSYGVANQFTLVMDTHKFERYYNDWLLGSLPEASERYRDRSPLFRADRIRDAVLLFQGGQDTVVPQNQSDSIAAALKRSGVPHEYHIYPDEGHGWRKPETKEDFYNQILSFLLVNVIYA